MGRVESSSIFFILIATALVSGGCTNVPDFVVPEPDPESSGNTISCKSCFNFGQIIEIYEDNLVIAEYENIYIYKLEDGIWKLSFENTNINSSGVQSVKIKGNRMAFGLADSDGTGLVEVYNYQEGTWSLEQVLVNGRRQDNFGSAIDIHENRMIIGANAPWEDDATFGNSDEGRIYIFSLQGDTWTEEAEFTASASVPDDFFGDAVAIYGNQAFAGGRYTEDLHVYKYSNSKWELDSLIDFEGVRAISHDENYMLLRNEVGQVPQLAAYTIENGELIMDQVGTDFNGENISDNGEIIEVYGTSALVDLQSADHTYLLDFSSGIWSEKEILSGNPEHSSNYHGLAISEDHIVIGGSNYVFISER
jgi:hypothetical protein